MGEKTFVILLEQKQEGCDYTIGCGYNYDFIEASSAKKAFEKWCHDNDLDDPEDPETLEYHAPGGEREYAQVMVIELATGETNEHLWTEFVDRRLNETASVEAEEQRKRDEAEFARLKEKLGK